MRKGLTLLLILTLLVAGVGRAENTVDPDAFVDRLFKVRRVIGGAVIVSRDGEVLYTRSYGFKERDAKNPVTLDTCYRIASVTKFVSAAGLVQLMVEKGLSPDTPVRDILKRNVVNPAYPDEPITVRQVLTHTTGLKSGMKYHPNWEILNKFNDRYFTEKTRPGTRYIYANLNGGLIGAMIEALSGQSVNTYMREHVFDPLGINAAYQPGLLPDPSDIANRLSKAGRIQESVAAQFEHYADYEDFCDPDNHTEYTVGQLYISARGLDAFLSMMCGNARGLREDVLPAGTVAEMTRAQNFEGSSVLVDKRYVLGMERLTDLPGGNWYGHQGMMDGLSSDTYFQPDTGLCVTVIANGYKILTTDGVASIAREVMTWASTELIGE